MTDLQGANEARARERRERLDRYALYRGRGYQPAQAAAAAGVTNVNTARKYEKDFKALVKTHQLPADPLDEIEDPPDGTDAGITPPSGRRSAPLRRTPGSSARPRGADPGPLSPPPQPGGHQPGTVTATAAGGQVPAGGAPALAAETSAPFAGSSSQEAATAGTPLEPLPPVAAEDAPYVRRSWLQGLLKHLWRQT